MKTLHEQMYTPRYADAEGKAGFECYAALPRLLDSPTRTRNTYPSSIQTIRRSALTLSSENQDCVSRYGWHLSSGTFLFAALHRSRDTGRCGYGLRE